jgi:imidazolonepropionase-like amidohydrolase
MPGFLKIPASTEVQMPKKTAAVYVYVFLFFLLVTVGGLPLNSESTIIKNVTVFLPDGTWQADSFITIKGCKIEKIGLMKTLKPGESKEIFDNEYDLKGHMIYPAFIDPLCKKFQKDDEKKTKASGRSQRPERSRSSRENMDREKRKPLAERNYFIKRQAVEQLQLDPEKAKEVMRHGFAVLHVISPDGIISGNTAVISLVSDNIAEAVLVPESFMALFLQPNSMDYPTTYAGLLAELNQLKADSSYYQKMKQLQFFNPYGRTQYIPEMDALWPYFLKEKRFLITADNYVEQRMVERIKQQLDIDLVMVAHPGVWRRTVSPDIPIILPLSFKPADTGKYAVQGKTLKKEAEEKIFPKKLASFFTSHKNISLAPPDSSDYQVLFKNIRALVKHGVTEVDIINALTINPARLLNISKYTGSLEKGKLANLIAADKKVFDPKAKIKVVFVEGKRFEFKAKETPKTPEKKKKDKKKPKKTSTAKVDSPGASLPGTRDLLLKSATIYTFDRGVLEGFDLLIREGKITQMAQNIQVKDNLNTINLQGKSIIPGIIDSHTHIGLSGGSNEMSENITPEVKMENQLDPDNSRIYYALTGGVTMVHTMHGSSNPIGGENVTIKLKWGRSAEDMIEKRAPRTLKMALGENPKTMTKNFPTTRMGVSDSIGSAYKKALNYRKQWENYQKKMEQTPEQDRARLIPPRKDYRMEALLDTIDKKMVIRCHTYRAEETLELIRLSKEFGFKIAGFEHIHQAYRIADELKADNIGISIFIDAWNYKAEASEFSPWGLELLHEKGVEISLNSDSGEIMRRLYMEAGKMRRYTGMNDLEALKTITLNPAKMLGVDHFTGSIEIGKDADLAVFDGHPLSSMSKCILTIIEGEIYFDRSKDPYAKVKER